VRVTILASGSGGNATLVQAGGVRVLLDAGIGPDVLRDRMTAVFGRALEIDAIVTTHAHGDHIGKVESVAASFGARVYMTQATQRRIRCSAPTVIYGYEVPFDVGPIHFEPMAIPHDAPQVALVFGHAGARGALITDLGEVPRRLADHLRGCQLVLLESNYDPEMLEHGPYPGFLKRRVSSRFGHLSNEQAAALIERLGPETTDIVLVHLSQKNNTPFLALRSARAALRGRRVRLRTAEQDTPLDHVIAPSARVKLRPHEAQLALPL
jgi:phosphoribosyl 1,2-cyclic phosphodiesterase